MDSTSGSVGEMAASAALSSTVLGRTVEQFEQFLARRGDESKEWLDATEASYGRLWLLPEEAKEVAEQFLRSVEKYRGRRSGRAAERGAPDAARGHAVPHRPARIALARPVRSDG